MHRVQKVTVEVEFDDLEPSSVHGWDFDAAQFSPAAQSTASPFAVWNQNGLCSRVQVRTDRCLAIDSVRPYNFPHTGMQPRVSFTSSLLQKYAVLPLYLRARVEGWNISSADLDISNHQEYEQVFLHAHLKHVDLLLIISPIKYP
jgi:hypothetical protein